MELKKNVLYSVRKESGMASIINGRFDGFRLFTDNDVEFHIASDGRWIKHICSDATREALERLVSDGRYVATYEDVSDDEFEAMLTS